MSIQPPASIDLPRILKAAACYCGLVLGTGFVLGMIRVPLLVPRLGERTAELIEMPVMFVAILVAARFILRRFHLPTRSVRLQVGFLALALSIAAELALTAALQEQSIRAYLAGRDPVSGSVYLGMLLLFALMPLLLVRK
jgi:hypothetical protein